MNLGNSAQMKKILITCPQYFPISFRTTLVEKTGLDLICCSETDRHHILNNLENVVVLCHRVETRIDRELLECGKDLKVIASATKGLDHIDVEAVKDYGITLFTDTSGSNTYPTAEMTIGMIFNLKRKITMAHENLVHKRAWDRHLFIGSELFGSTLGLVGCGDIGSRVATMASTLGMHVHVYDPYLDMHTIGQFGAHKSHDLETLLSTCNVVCIHCPLNASTRHLIGRRELELLHPGSILINVSRGAVIDTSALLQVLNERDADFMVALDVFEEEPLNSNHPLLEYASTHSNLLVTPHIAGSTNESISRCCQQLLIDISHHMSDLQNN